MLDAVISLVSVTTLLLGSPGPAPIALSASGATYGVKKSTPFLLGILLGLSMAIVCAIAGLALLLVSFPKVAFTMQVMGALYVIYIAYKIATAPFQTITSSDHSAAPNFMDGFILNILNPKAYAAFLAIFSQFLLPIQGVVTSYIVTGLICLAVATLVDVLWLLSGGIIRPILSEPKSARFVRVSLAVVMVLVVLFTLINV